MDWIQQTLEFLTSAEGMAATLAIVLEFVFRLIPTKKPLSVLRIAATAVKGLAAIFTKLDALLDKIVPQNAEEKE